MNNDAERSLFSRCSMVCVGLSFFTLSGMFSLFGIILGLVGLLKNEEQKNYAIAGILISIFRLCGALYLY